MPAGTPGSPCSPEHPRDVQPRVLVGDKAAGMQGFPPLPYPTGLRRVPGVLALPLTAPSPAECRSPSCESCFSKDFCMKCKEKFYLHKGKCFRQCPPSTAAQPGTRECQGKRHPHPAHRAPRRRGMVTVPSPRPHPTETCEPGPWSEWSACTHEGRSCGSKWGLETRVREVPGTPREEGAACPALLESRRCRLRKQCPGGERSPGCTPQPPDPAQPPGP